MNKNLLSGTALTIVAALFLAFTIIINMSVKGARLDLTQDKLYTMSEGTKEIVKKIDEPINLYFYYSDKLTKNVTQIRTFALRIKELLQEYEAISAGKIKLHIIDPEPFSEEEDKAAEFGMKAVPLTTESKIYLGLAGTNSIDDQEVISFFQPDRESFLEYDISKLINTLAHPQKKSVGLISSIPIYGQINPRTGQPENGLMIYQQITKLFDVHIIDPSFTEIGSNINTLLVIHPKSLSQQALYAIDQFVLGGGKAIVMIDPFADIEVAVQGNQMQDRLSDKSSNLSPLLEAWGVQMNKELVMADENYAIPVAVNYQDRPISHLSVLGFDEKSFNKDDIVSNNLGIINMAHAGILTPIENHTTTLTPLIQSSTSSASLPVERVKFTVDPNQLFEIFSPGNKHLTASYRISGTAKSAFPQGISEEGNHSDHLVESKDPINVIVIADVDMLHDQLWVSVQDFYGQKIPNPFAHNANFIINSLENLSGSIDLISIRNRGTYTRPFDLVNKLRKDAEERYRETEQQLIQRLNETEKKITDLQSQRENQNSLLLTPEQEQAVLNFKSEKLLLRKELREVRHQLDKEIENLGARIKVLNIGLIPILIAIFGLLIALIQTSKRNRKIKD